MSNENKKFHVFLDDDDDESSSTHNNLSELADTILASSEFENNESRSSSNFNFFIDEDDEVNVNQDHIPPLTTASAPIRFTDDEDINEDDDEISSIAQFDDPPIIPPMILLNDDEEDDEDEDFDDDDDSDETIITTNNSEANSSVSQNAELASMILRQSDDIEYETVDVINASSEQHLEDDNSISSNSSKTISSISHQSESNESQQLQNRVNKALGLSKSVSSIDSSETETDFGEYEIIYPKDEKIPDKYTKLNEDVKINDIKRDYKDVTNKIRDNYEKYQNERAEIQTFLEFGDTELKVSEARSLIEACLFVLGSEGLNVYDIKKVTNLPLAVVNSVIEEMMYYYDKNPNSGIKLVQYGNRYKFISKQKHYDVISLVINKKERKPLSEGVLETLAIIAYNQPCTRSTVEKIRNKNSTNAILRLEELGLIEANERSEAMGKPWLYTLTQKFFDKYGIKSLSELPPINRDDRYYQDNEEDSDIDFISEINEE